MQRALRCDHTLSVSASVPQASGRVAIRLAALCGLSLLASQTAVNAATPSSASGEKAAPSRPTASERSADSRPPVLLELFTSEGCSSCPPADELLAQLAASGFVEDTPVIALELHVDYWNHLGWRDPFSDAAYSARQASYVGFMGLRGAYTPQLVVDGRVDVLGSSGTKARAAILTAAESKRARLQLSFEHHPDTLVAALSDLPGQRVILYAAITERGLTTHVPRGENAGRTLPHGPIVRWLEVVARGDAGRLRATVPLRISKSWRRPELRVVAFAQDEKTGHILGAAERPLPSK